MIQEPIKAKSEILLPVVKGDVEMVDRFGIHGISLALACIGRGRCVKKKVQRMGRWLPPPIGFLKINMDGSSRGNLGSAWICGICRDSYGLVVFIFSANRGM